MWQLFSKEKLQIYYSRYLELYMKTHDNIFHNKMDEIRQEIFK